MRYDQISEIQSRTKVIMLCKDNERFLFYIDPWHYTHNPMIARQIKIDGVWRYTYDFESDRIASQQAAAAINTTKEKGNNKYMELINKGFKRIETTLDNQFEEV